MAAAHPNSFKARKTLAVGSKSYTYWSLKAVEKEVGDLSRLPFSLRILMENLVRHEDGTTVKKADIAAARKGTRFIRFCNLYNIPLIFMEDTTGFLPGVSQEHNGIVLEGRKLLDSIIDVRTPRITTRATGSISVAPFSATMR